MMHTPTVLLVIEGTYPWYRGGVSEWVHQYITAFQDVHFTICQIATDEYRDASLEDALYDLPSHVQKLIRIPPPDVSTDWKQDSSEWLSSGSKDLSTEVDKADLIHVANTGFAGWLGMQFAGRYDKPLILTEHALYWKEVQMGAVALECGYRVPEHEAEKARITDLFKGIARQVYQAADQVISVSEINLSDQQNMGAGNLHYIPNGVDRSWLKPQTDFSDPLTVGWIGRCAEMKNPLRFFEVADALSPQAECIMMLCDAGENGLKRRVIEQCRHTANVELIWNRPAIEHIDQMDALCITSHNESQPLVLFEALSRKVLPVGWQVGDVTSKYGLVVDYNATVDGLAGRLLELWQTPDRWRDELTQRFERVKEHHTWQAIFSRYKELLAPYLHPEAQNRQFETQH